MSSTTALRIPDAPAFDGLEFRRMRDGEARTDDYAAMAELATIANIHDGIPWAPTPESLAAELENSATSDPAVDLILAEVEGELVASASTERATRDGEWVHDVFGVVHPHWRRRGLGRALLRANVARARQVAAGSSEAAVLSAHADETEAGHTALLQSEGFSPVRWYVLMVRDLGDPVPALPLPPGLEVRPVLPEHHE
jgi:mycothiol synthase